MKRVLLPILLLLSLAAAGCGSSSSTSVSTAPSSVTSTPSKSPAPTPTSAAGATQVTMKNLAFTPAVVHAKVGQTVVWTNLDTPPHNVTYVSGPKFTSSGTLNTGGKFSLKLTQAGTIQYFCTIHPFMKATIIVTK